MYQAYVYAAEQVTPSTSLWDSLMQCVPALRDKARPIIAFTGAGGKTTWIYELAKELRRRGKTVLITTTTHMYRPKRWAVLGNDRHAIMRQLRRDGIAVAGIPVGTVKISALRADCLAAVQALADVTLVEADGCRHRPCKALGPREPVIPAGCDTICCLVGLTAVGQPVGRACFRHERTGVPPETTLTIPVISRIWQEQCLAVLQRRHPNIPCVPIVHQAGTTQERRQAWDILRQAGVGCGLISSVAVDVACVYLASGFGRRFGQNKLLAPLRRKPLFAHGLAHLQDACKHLQEEGYTSAIYVVSPYDRICTAAQAAYVSVVPNYEAAEGQAASVRAGVAAVPTAKRWAFFAADQPFLRGETIAAFLQSFCESGQTIGCVRSGQRQGSPAVFAASHRDDLLGLRGDTGGRPLLQKYEQTLWRYDVAPAELVDIDTPDVLRQYDSEDM